MLELYLMTVLGLACGVLTGFILGLRYAYLELEEGKADIRRHKDTKCWYCGRNPN